MYSFHLAGSPWFLLLIPFGTWLLWKANGSGRERAGRLLFGLQALALVLLAASLAGPELRRHEVRFHDPVVLVLRDQSASFRAGATLGLGGRYAEFRNALAAAYAARKAQVRVADFAASAWPVDGFPRMPGPPAPAAGDPTSLAAAADFADSADIPNLQAVFLFTDGRGVLDSGKSARAWRAPVHPVVFASDSVAEAQLLSAAYDGGMVRVEWQAVGRDAGEPRLRIVRDGRVLAERRLPAGPASGPAAKRAYGFPWNPPPGGGALRAVLEPASAADDFDPWNDTLDLALPGGGGAGRVLALKPLRSLDEKGLFEALRAGGPEVGYFAAGEAGSLSPQASDQVWIEAGALADASLARWARNQPAKVVVYSRCGDGNPDPGLSAHVPALGGAWQAFSSAAAIKASRAADAFPDEVVRLQYLSAFPLRAPPLPAGGALAEIREGGKSGMLMGRIDLGSGKRALFACLPAIWGSLFDPQGDYAVRENIGAYARAARAMAAREEGAARVSLPRRAVAGLPFDASIDWPEGDSGAAAFGLAGGGFAREWTAAGPPPWVVRDVTVPSGRFRAWARSGADTLWRDSLIAAPPEALELARLGFDETALSDAAAGSGGAVLRPAGPDVASLLPRVTGAQIRTERVIPVPLYNTLPLGLAVIGLLALSWLLRKKWDLD